MCIIYYYITIPVSNTAEQNFESFPLRKMDLHGIVSKIVIDIHGSNFKTHEELWNKTLLAVPELGTIISNLKGKYNGDKHKCNERFNDFIKLWGDIFALQIGKYTAAGCRIIERYRKLFGETLSDEFKSFIEPILASASPGKNILYFKICLLLSLNFLFTVGSAQPLPTPADLHGNVSTDNSLRDVASNSTLTQQTTQTIMPTRQFQKQPIVS